MTLIRYDAPSNYLTSRHLSHRTHCFRERRGYGAKIPETGKVLRVEDWVVVQAVTCEPVSED